MAEKERIDWQVMDIDMIVRNARQHTPTITPERALELIIGKVQFGTGFYIWTHIGDTWFIRQPRLDLPDEAWLKKVVAEPIHVCNPVQFLTALETKAEKNVTAQYVGLGRDTDSVETEMGCKKCGVRANAEISKRAKVICKLHNLAQNIGEL